MRIEDVIETKAAVLFADRQIEVRVKVTNLSDRTWLNANAFTCFTFTHADAFDDKRMTRSFVQIGNTWRTLADLFRERSPGGSALTFLGVRGGLMSRTYGWLGRSGKCIRCDSLRAAPACFRRTANGSLESRPQLPPTCSITPACPASTPTRCWATSSRAKARQQAASCTC
mgnify:CR=1 FL=1